MCGRSGRGCGGSRRSCRSSRRGWGRRRRGRDRRRRDRCGGRGRDGRLLGLRQDTFIDKRTQRRNRLIRGGANGGNAVEISRNLLAESNKAMQGVEQQKGEECDRVAPYATSQRK